MRIAAVDGGQTGLRLRVVGPDGSTATATAGGFDYDAGDPAATVLALVKQAWDRLPAAGREPVDRVGMGLTGDHRPEEVRRIEAGVADLLGAGQVEVRIAHDAVTAHLGALGGAPGVVVVAGTGVVALARTGDRDGSGAGAGAGAGAGVTARVDGWGHLLGDEGGGFAVGRHGLRAALAAYDGRGPRTALAAAAVDRFGPLDGLPRRLYGTGATVADVAGFSRQVAEAARAGDPVAVGIWRDGVAALVGTTRAAVSRYLELTADQQPAAEPGTVAVSWAGGLMGVADLVRDPWRRRVAAEIPQTRVVDPVGDGLDGAVLLATGNGHGRTHG
ncbi:N-acetylglucosamine kinase [Actinopolymorpha cephalotaxi]|uniref:N-acetylglucosamine kinase-like BadF-type ATPase n=1 Tax=Actinopolymorpha cephalotaxi TaxID=504797 RepID=A0ABX2SBU9_9ACTN|nr:BadF/BadG/BcrA/BcrD ATPase family protein [Actinopolymorpha cephalotaxi]NYH87140.1 N-acetylglucosamine kinase-like BadF-type ATPase [Actinopolymorpha cephalotaxi]